MGKGAKAGIQMGGPARFAPPGALTLLLTALALLLLLLAAPAAARKTHLPLKDFGGAEPLHFSRVATLALDHDSGDLLVVESDANTLSRFKLNGEPDPFSALGTNVIDAKKGPGGKACAEEPASCDQTPQDGFEFGPFTAETQVAVDESGTVTDGNIYVTQGSKFSEHLIDVFASSGKYLGQITAAGGTPFGTVGSFPFSPCGVAVDANGNLFVGAGYDDKIYRFDPSANPPLNSDLAATFSYTKPICSLALGVGASAGSIFANTYATFAEKSVLKLSTGLAFQGIFYPGESQFVAVNPDSGHIFVAGGDLSVNIDLVNVKVGEYDASGSSPVLVSEFAENSLLLPHGIAAKGSGAEERIYAGQRSSSADSVVNVYGPLVIVPDVTTGEVSVDSDTSVTLRGVVNPDGVALEECRFEYGKTAQPYEHAEPCAESVAEIGTGETVVHLPLASLTPETLYHYRLVAKNVNATTNGADRTFHSPSKPTIVSQWAQDVSTDVATVKAKVNPQNSETAYRLQWGPTAAYGNETAQQVVAPGRDAEDHVVSVALPGLEPGATYHYRFLASNSIGGIEGPDRSFTAFPSPPEPKTDCPNLAYRSGASAALPDCRAYEMVSPVDKGGGDILARVNVTGYETALDQSSVDGEKLAYSSYRTFGEAEGAPYTAQYVATRGEGEWSTRSISPPREGPELLLGGVEFDNEYWAFSPDLCQSWLLHGTEPTLAPGAPSGFPDLYRRQDCAGGGAYEALIEAAPPHLEPKNFKPELQGYSADGSCAVFRLEDNLTPDAPELAETDQLYESCGGELRLLSILPGGTVSELSASAGTANLNLDRTGRTASVAGAVSADGQRVFWTASATAGQGQIYLRMNPFAAGAECASPVSPCTVAVSKKAEELSKASKSHFWAGAADGSRAVFTSGEDLYEFKVSTSETRLIARETLGVLGASEDASRVYFVSPRKLAAAATAGKPNLYLSEVGNPIAFIAILSSADVDQTGNTPTAINPTPIRHTAEVSPDGRYLAFTSDASLTGFDNADAATGEPDTEIFYYEAGAAAPLCVSCLATGARPAGRQASVNNSFPRGTAAQLPPFENQLYQPRYLSDDGSRLFFESFDALIPRDTNGAQDVYEWAPSPGSAAEGEAQCEAQGADLYVASSGGCLSLISSGKSSSDSYFMDASPSGRDIFFTTAQSLLPQDPGSYDAYDARVEGGFAEASGPPEACEGEACQGTPEAPNDPTPASESFQGAGNVVEGATTPARKPCAKGKVRRKHKCVARKHRKAARRAKHNRRAGR